MRKIVLSLLIFVMVSLMMAGVFATIPKPSVPEFTVELVDLSYDMPASTTQDPIQDRL